jgi:DNA polymerase-3 subunit beta
MAFANQKTMMATLTFENNQITLKTQDIDYSVSAQEIIDCNYNNEPITIGFPCNGLIEVIKNVRCDDVAIKMSEPQRAGLIIPSSQPVDTEYVSIQMPMQV